MHGLAFTKGHGTENDFVLVPDPEGRHDLTPDEVRALADRRAGVGGDGVIGSYRKIHLPFLGIDMFTNYGDRPFAVQEYQGMNIGMNICYDGGFPESARCLALLGADLIVLPTNWPPGRHPLASGSTHANCSRATTGTRSWSTRSVAAGR